MKPESQTRATASARLVEMARRERPILFPPRGGPMLILSRHLGQSVTAGPVTVTVQAIRGDTVQLRVEGGAARLGPGADPEAVGGAVPAGG